MDPVSVLVLVPEGVVGVEGAVDVARGADLDFDGAVEVENVWWLITYQDIYIYMIERHTETNNHKGKGRLTVYCVIIITD